MTATLSDKMPDCGLSSDICAPLIATWRAVQAGWVPPTRVSEEEYQAAKSLPDSDPLKAFAAFGCSYGGVWSGGYARSKGRNYAAEASRSLLRKVRPKTDVTYTCLDWVKQPIINPKKWVIYCDPPYANTQGYDANAGTFDFDAFLSRATEWAEAGASVFVSSYDTPGLDPIWEKSYKAGLPTKNKTRTDRLYRL